MRLFKRILFILLAVLIFAAVYNYPKLNIISGYASKNMASSVFIANRASNDIRDNDNNIPLIKLAHVEIHEREALASVFGLMERKTVCRDGLGCVLVNDAYDAQVTALKPERNKLVNDKPFPFGNDGIYRNAMDNVNYQQLEKAVDYAFVNPEVQKTRTVLVAYKNRFLTERYADGFSPETPILGWSMTKSVLATLFGIMQYENKIDMDYQPFSELDLTGLVGKDPREFISLDDLLRMSSGMHWDEDYGSISDVTKMLFLDSDMTQAQINTEYNSQEPKVWNYSSGTSNLLSGILRKQFKTYQEYLDFPYAALIDKIGMHSMIIETDMAGNYVGSSYGWANTRDWAKFGLLYLNNGNWNGEQLFDKSWVDYVTRPTAQSSGTYGAHFWLNAKGKYPDVPRDMYSANGFQGQRVWIIPSKELVVVRTGLAEEPDFDVNGFLKGIIASID